MKLRKFIDIIIHEYLNEQQEMLNNIWYHGSKEKFDKVKSFEQYYVQRIC